jgi:hypothetical protein
MISAPRARKILLVSALLGLGTACFPVELDVRDGKLLIVRGEGTYVLDPASGSLTLVRAPDQGPTVFARFSPKGDEVLTVTARKDGFNDHDFLVGPTAGGPARVVYQAKDAGYVRWSPDGAWLAVSQLSPEKNKEFDKQLPEVVLVPSGGGPAVHVLTDTVGTTRWFKDSKRILAFRATAKVEGVGRTKGELVVASAAKGKPPVLATAIVADGFTADLSPDESHVVFPAYACVAPGGKLPDPDFATHLCEVDVAKGTVRQLDQSADYAFYAPDGQHVLVGWGSGSYGSDVGELAVADAGLNAFTPLAHDAAKPGNGSEPMYPGWLDAGHVYYFGVKVTWGASNRAVMLYTIGADGTGRKNLQPMIEAALADK